MAEGLRSRLREHIQTLNTAQVEAFAEVCELHPNTLHLLARGSTRPTLDTASRIFRGMGHTLTLTEAR